MSSLARRHDDVPGQCSCGLAGTCASPVCAPAAATPPIARNFLRSMRHSSSIRSARRRFPPRRRCPARRSARAPASAAAPAWRRNARWRACLHGTRDRWRRPRARCAATAARARHEPAADGEAAQLQERHRHGHGAVRRGCRARAAAHRSTLRSRATARVRRIARAAAPSACVGASALSDCVHLVEKRAERRAAVAADLAADEIVRLDARRAFVDRRDAHVAQGLRGAGFLDVAHAAVHLDADRRDLDAALGAEALDDRNQQVAARLRGGAHRLVGMRVAEIELVRRVQRQRARRLRPWTSCLATCASRRGGR